MPRLEGAHSGSGMYIFLLIVIAIIAAVLALEYVGIINMIPTFGAI